MDFTPTFRAIAQFRLSRAQAIGEKFLDHCLHCGNCRHVGDDNLSVYLCKEAKKLEKDFEEAKKAAIPYANAFGVKLSE
jgi:hypothetical protein